MNVAKKCLVWIQRLFVALALGFIAVAAKNTWPVVEHQFLEANPAFLLSAVALWVLLQFIPPLLSVCLFRAESGHLGYASALHIHVNRLPAKYLPGGIWNSVTRFADYRQKNNTPRQVSMVLVQEHLIALTATIFLFFLCSKLSEGWHPGLGVVRDSSAVFIAFIGIAALVVASLVAVRWSQAANEKRNTHQYLLALCAAVIFWVGAGFSFVSYVNAFVPETVDLVATAGTYFGAWSIGFVALFAPQGFGVFETVVALGLELHLDYRALVIVALGFRLIVLVADLAAFVAYWGLVLSLRLARKFRSTVTAR